MVGARDRGNDAAGVAEGVEEENQAVVLAEMGCTYLQGYHLGKPMPKEHILEAIKINKGAN